MIDPKFRPIELSSRCIEACIAPEIGGRFTRLRWIGSGAGTDIIVPLLAWGADPFVWPRAGAYPLIPYSNRITNGRLTFEGQTHGLEIHGAFAPHALHGKAHLRRWTVDASDAASASLSLLSPADGDWAWRFEAHQTVLVHDDQLEVKLSIINRDTSRMPAGLGWHPYFRAEAGMNFKHDAKKSWALGSEGLPSGDVVRIGREVGLSSSQGTLHLSDWRSGEWRPAPNLHLRMTADPVFDHLITHTEPGASYLCVEPVTHVANGFNLAAAGAIETGLQVLEPGQEMSGTIRLHFNS
jgi:aldose 1-epimerase